MAAGLRNRDDAGPLRAHRPLGTCRTIFIKLGVCREPRGRLPEPTSSPTVGRSTKGLSGSWATRHRVVATLASSAETDPTNREDEK